MVELLNRTPRWLRHDEPAVAGLLLAGWLLEQDGPDVSDTIARAAVPTVDLDVLRDVVGDISYMLRQAQALEDDPAAALHALGIVVHPGNRIEDVAGERCDSLRQDARGAAEIAATRVPAAAPSSDVTRGLRELADFLDQHPDVPPPDYPTLQVTLRGDDSGLADVGRIAAILGTPVDLTRADGGHRLTQRSFGPVEYRAVSITDERMALHNALMSYTGSVSA